MRTAKLAACLSTLALAATLSAQSHDPVPTRIRTQTHLATSGVPEPTTLGIQLDCTGYDQAAVQVFGAQPNNLAVWLIGARPTELPVFGAMVLVQPDIATTVSTFDEQGRTAMPVPLEMKELIGQRIYFQGIEIGASQSGSFDRFETSESLSVRWHPGCVQPPINYDGPPFTGILVHSLGTGTEAPDYDIYASIVAPTSGYRLVAEGVLHDPGVTSLYLRLIEPEDGSIVLPVVEDHRCLIPIGKTPEAKIAIYIARVDPDSGWLLFELAALIDRDF